MRTTRNAEVGTRNRKTPICFAFRVPRSGVKHRRLFRGPGGSKAEVSIRPRRRAPAARRAGKKALLHQEGFVHLLERPRVLAHGGCDGREAHRATLELLEIGRASCRERVSLNV